MCGYLIEVLSYALHHALDIGSVNRSENDNDSHYHGNTNYFSRFG